VSNYLAIATVTATLQRILQMAVQQDVDGMRVTTLQPGQIGNGTPETGINLFLYQVSRNPVLKNADHTAARAKGSPAKRQAALDLYYLISLYGNEAELEPQRLLGSVIRTLSDRPTLLPEAIRDTIADTRFRFLADSDLAEQIQHASIHALDLSLDDLSKVWSTFFQAPYRLSTTYRITLVTIEGEESLSKALPVRDRSFGAILPFPAQPVVEQVKAGPLEPILASSTLTITGKQLHSPQTRVLLGGVEATPTQVSEGQIVVPLAAFPSGALRAGIQGLQVAHLAQPSSSGAPGRLQQLASNALPIVLRPTIEQIELLEVKGEGEDLRSGRLRLRVDLPVGQRQRVVLAMNQASIEQPVGYQIEASGRTADTQDLTFNLRDIKSGDYLLRLQIDGADSILGVDTDPKSPTFNWYNSPKIQIA
jgi:hypothetical protein